jgi:hypothetical protein
MSTKSTLAHGLGFHLYNEVFENDTVYLELEKVDFECDPDRVTVTIPVVVWEVIRQSAGADFSWAAKSDDEIRSYVEQAVQERITAFQDEDLGLKRSLGIGIFGKDSEPSDKQIEKGLAYYFGVRDRQRTLLKQIHDLTDRVSIYPVHRSKE